MEPTCIKHTMNHALLEHMARRAEATPEPPPAVVRDPKAPLIFVDLETTGLDEHKGFPLEIALVAVDPDSLAIIDSYTSVVATVEGHKHLLALPVDDYIYEMHQESGLLAAVRDSEPFATPGAAVQGAIRWLKRHTQAGASSLGGNSPHFDRRWIQHHWPELNAWFHRRNIDVSTLRQLWAVWDLPPFPKPPVAHRALDDLFDCVAELRHYRTRIR